MSSLFECKYCGTMHSDEVVHECDVYELQEQIDAGLIEIDRLKAENKYKARYHLLQEILDNRLPRWLLGVVVDEFVKECKEREI